MKRVFILLLCACTLAMAGGNVTANDGTSRYVPKSSDDDFHPYETARGTAYHVDSLLKDWARCVGSDYKSFYTDTINGEVKLLSPRIDISDSANIDTLVWNIGTGTRVTISDSATVDTLVVTQLRIGAGSSFIDTLRIIDGTNDTLAISVGTKTWKFDPIADQ